MNSIEQRFVQLPLFFKNHWKMSGGREIKKIEELATVKSILFWISCVVSFLVILDIANNNNNTFSAIVLTICLFGFLLTRSSRWELMQIHNYLNDAEEATKIFGNLSSDDTAIEAVHKHLMSCAYGIHEYTQKCQVLDLDRLKELNLQFEKAYRLALRFNFITVVQTPGTFLTEARNQNRSQS